MNAALVSLVTLALSLRQEPESPKFPTFEPFVASRMFKLFGDPAEADLEQLAQEVSMMTEAMKAADEAAKPYAPPESGVSCRLGPEIPEDQRNVAPLVPLVMMKLAPLWSSASWSKEQVSDARAALGILNAIPDAPRATFAEGKDAENRAGLEQIVAWFRAKVARPEWYAAMIFTFDDGPFAGLPHEEALTGAPHSAQKLDETTELRLHRVERENEPWVLQAVRDGKPLWSRVVSGAPDESVTDASFLEDPVVRVGSYGWKVQMSVTWSQGTELCEVFLDPQANLLFYFLSW
jgi:hypothetical protein